MLRVEGLVADAVSNGAVLLTGGPSNGVLMPATVVDHVTPTMRLFREESFGPVVAVVRAKDEAEAIRARMQDALHDMLRERRSVWFG